MDLDTVIVGDLSVLVKHIPSSQLTSRFVTLNAAELSTEGRPCGINSSFMCWGGNGPSSRLRKVFDFLVDHYDAGTGSLVKLDHYLEMMMPPLGMEIVSVQTACPGIVTDYQDLPIDADSCRSQLCARGAAIVCFPLRPKPHEIPRESLLGAWWN